MIELNDSLTLQDFMAVVRNFEEVRLSGAARKRVEKSRTFIEKIIEQGDPVYGVNTGFGKFQNTRIERDMLEELQRNLILSHSIGVGEPFPKDVVRGMLLLRAQSLAMGHSGVRPLVIEGLRVSGPIRSISPIGPIRAHRVPIEIPTAMPVMRYRAFTVFVFGIRATSSG